jgi:hypothetical protein
VTILIFKVSFYYFIMFRNKVAAAIAVNTVVMMIIGLTIFGLGMGLFGKISGGAEDEIDSLNNKIKSDIASLECDGDEWICVPSYKIKNGDQETFEMFIANHGESSDKFKIELGILPLTDGNGNGIEKSDCGSVAVSYLESAEVNIRSGYSGALPFIVKATRVSKTPCSFITIATLSKVGVPATDFEEKTSVIIRVE